MKKISYIFFAISLVILLIYRLGKAKLQGVKLGLYAVLVALAIKAYRKKKGSSNEKCKTRY